MNCLEALPYTECLSGLSYPIPIAHLAAQQLPEQINHCLEYSLESTLNVYLDSIPNSRLRAFCHLLIGSIGLNEAKALFQRKRQLKRFIYKEPFFSFAPSFVYRALPNCKIIYLYRDGRDCANSLVRMYNVLTDEKLKTLKSSESSLGYQSGSLWIPWWVTPGQSDDFIQASPYVRAIWMWKEMVNCCESFFSQPDIEKSERILKIKYEDLTREPMVLGEKIVNHVGADFNNKIQRRFKKASIKSIGKYKGQDALEIKLAEQVAYHELNLYGYLE